MLKTADQTLVQAFTHACDDYHEQTALINYHADHTWSYTQLHQLVMRMAHYLQTECHVTPGQKVGLLMCNHMEFVVSFFALQWLGVVVVPLNYKLTAEELQLIIEDAELVGLIGKPSDGDVLKHLSWFVYSSPLDETVPDACPWFDIKDWLADHEVPVTEAYEGRVSGDVAVLLYTSGTTGKPKGVMLSHQNLLSVVQMKMAAIDLVEEDVFVTVAPLFHVYGLTNILLTGLFNGVTVVLVRRFSPKRILEAIDRYGVTFLTAVPTMYQMMLVHLKEYTYDLTSLRVCHSGAAPMPKPVFEAIEQVFQAPLQEGYGLTESSSIATANPLEGPRKPGSIGKPITGVCIEIVDVDRQRQAPNVVGELRIKGAGVMIGYWQNPEATEKRLQEEWLYTGDMGYVDEEGYLFLVGRKDDMMNVGGVQVAPREVEDVLLAHTNVAQCAVVGEEDELYHHQVVAYVVPVSISGLSEKELQKFCREQLADFKVPKAVRFVEEIPQGTTGKILRHQLKSS